MRKLETCAGYAARSTLEQGAAKPSWGGKTQPGHAPLLNLQVPAIPMPDWKDRGGTGSGMQGCFAALLPEHWSDPLASGLPGPDHSPSWQQCLVLSMLVVSYLPLACISPSLSLLPVRVGNYTCASPLPHRQREPGIPRSQDHPRPLWQPQL